MAGHMKLKSRLTNRTFGDGMKRRPEPHEVVETHAKPVWFEWMNITKGCNTYGGSTIGSCYRSHFIITMVIRMSIKVWHSPGLAYLSLRHLA
jgi:hypothetical protein